MTKLSSTREKGAVGRAGDAATRRRAALIGAGAVGTIALVAVVLMVASGRSEPSGTSGGALASGTAASGVASGAGATGATDEPVVPGGSSASTGGAQDGSLPPTGLVRAPDAPRSVAPTGSILTTLSAPPIRTLAFIKVPEGFSAGRFKVEFEPYGLAPSSQGKARAVVRLTSASAIDESASSLKREFAGTNVVVEVPPGVARRLKTGGPYAGTIEIVARGDNGAFVLVAAVPVER